MLAIFTKTFSKTEKRTEYFEKFLVSLNQNTPEFLHFIYDDASTEPKMKMILDNLKVANKQRNKYNAGVANQTRKLFLDMIDLALVDSRFQFFAHIDSDYIFAPRDKNNLTWLHHTLQNIDSFTPVVLTPFRREDGNEKPIRQVHNYFEVESFIGGCVIFTKMTILKIKENWSSVEYALRDPRNWDYNLSQLLRSMNIPIFATINSFAQHIGLEGENQPFQTTNFVGDDPKEVKIIRFNSDLGDNASRLFFATQNPKYKTFVDIGVREGHSSQIMLESAKDKKDAKVYGVDSAFSDELKKIENPKYELIISDSIECGKEWKKEKPDFVFIDTTHTKEQVMGELHYWWDLLNIGGTMAFHDTFWQGHYEQYAGEKYDLVDAGVKEFFQIPNLLYYEDDFIRVDSFPESMGMTFIQKKAEKDFKVDISQKKWKEIFKTTDKIREFQSKK